MPELNNNKGLASQQLLPVVGVSHPDPHPYASLPAHRGPVLLKQKVSAGEYDVKPVCEVKRELTDIRKARGSGVCNKHHTGGQYLSSAHCGTRL